MYGLEGRLDRKFISSTKKVLKAIAGVTDQLKKSFDLPPSRSATGISRIAAHLHLLHHQVSICKERRKYQTEPGAVRRFSNKTTIVQLAKEAARHIG